MKCKEIWEMNCIVFSNKNCIENYLGGNSNNWQNWPWQAENLGKHLVKSQRMEMCKFQIKNVINFWVNGLVNVLFHKK